MTHPAPTDIVGSLAWIMEEITALRRERQERRVSAAEAAESLGYGREYFHGKPWRIPGFARNGTYLSLAEYQAWDARPEAERRAEWDAMPLHERARLRGTS